MLRSCHLDADVAFDVVYESTNSDAVVLLPLLDPSHQVFLLFEKENFAGASGDEGLAIVEHHLTQLLARNLFEAVVFRVVCVDAECLALAVEAIDLIPFLIIEALPREVLDRALQFPGHNILGRISGGLMLFLVILFAWA